MEDVEELALPGAAGIQDRVQEYLERPPVALGPRLVQLAIMFIILVNVTAVVVGTMHVQVNGEEVLLETRYARAFNILEQVSVAIFTVEYLLRLWSCTVDRRYARPVLGRLRYAVTPMALVDLVSILPAYFQAGGFIAARALRLVRIFRVFKLGHYSLAIRTLNRAIVSKRAELLVTVFIIGILLILVSTVMYYAENEAQPDKFSSIPATMWWGIVTLTTVGYGDISPITTAGKFMGGLVAIFGIGLVALPAGILGSAFVQELESTKTRARCPHCGKEI